VGRFLSTVVVTLHGNVDLINAATLADVLHDLIDGQGNLAVVVDLRDVRWVDGAGVGVLASAASRIETRGGELRLAGPGAAVAEALALSGLGRLVGIPFEQAHRPWRRARSEGEASRRTFVDADPADNGPQGHER
jgi:anti-sigma B factor antagonist